MQCEQYQILIQRYLDNDLNEQEQKQLFEHIASCSNCKQEFDEFRALHEQLLAIPKVEMNDSCLNNIMSEIMSTTFNDSTTDIDLTTHNDLATFHSSTAGGDLNNKVPFYRKYNKFIISGLAAAAVLLFALISDDYRNNDTHLAGEEFNSTNNVNDSIDMAALEMDSNLNTMMIQPDIADNNKMDNFTMSKQGRVLNFGVDKANLLELDFKEEKTNNIPKEVKDWFERSKDIYAGQSYVYDGKTYILVSLGKQYNNHYSVMIEDIFSHSNALFIYTNINEPLENRKTEQTAIYPYHLVSVEGEYYQVDFNEWQGAEINSWVPEIYGIEAIPKFNENSSEIIKIYSPMSGEVLEESVYIKGIARTFEGAIYYRIITDDDEEIASGYINSAKGAPDWGYFEQEIFIDLPSTMDQIDAVIEVYEIGMKDGGKVGTVVTPITIKANHDGNGNEFITKQYVSYLVRDVNISKQQLHVEQISIDMNNFKAPNIINTKGIPIIRDITNEKANNASQYADIKEVRINSEIGAIVTAEGKVKQIFLFD